MRHRVFGRKLGRDKNTRKALFKNLISSLILQGEIKTTESRAKAIKGLVERLVSRARQKTLHARRLVSVFLQDKKVVNKLVDEIAPRFVGRPGGFTRILRLGGRAGDQAMMVKMEFIKTPETKATNQVVKPAPVEKKTSKEEKK